MTFINPYNFVPLPQSVSRSAPQGHDLVKDSNVMGTIDVTWTARSRLLLGTGTGDDFNYAMTNGRRVVPGSALHGAIRAFHEALTGSCLRVIDLEHLPIHRHPLHSQDHRRFKLAIVTQSTNGSAKFRELKNVIWVRARLFKAPPKSGDHVDLSSEHESRMRSGTATISEVGKRVVLVADNGAKEGRSTNFATGLSPTSDQPEFSCDAMVVNQFAEAIRGSVDDGKESGFVPVRDNSTPNSSSILGWRRRETGELAAGEPYWICVNNQNQVTEIRPALTWRYEGRHSIHVRLEANGQTSLLPCGHDNVWTGALELCPSCQIFGSAAPTQDRDEDDPSEVRAYRGHVLVGEAQFVGEPNPTSLRLAPLGAPKITAGQFYLDNSNRSTQNTSQAIPPPALAAWGSDADRPTPRKIRGRKFYWAVDTPGASDRARRRASLPGRAANEDVAREVLVHDAGTVLQSSIQFVNLTKHQLATLLVAISPALHFPGSVLRIGGGKPFGFGSVTTDLNVTVWEGAGRYRGEEPKTLDATAQRTWISENLGEPNSAWPHLAAMSKLNPEIGDAPVWYPSDGEGQPGTAAFDDGFGFWKRTAGHHPSTHVPNTALISLKPATDPDQELH